jgi:ATP-binding cassette subfamily B protein
VLLVYERYIDDINKGTMLEKSLSLNYEILENKETLERLHKAMDGTKSRGGLGVLCYNAIGLVQSLFSIVYAIVLVVELFKKANVYGDDFLLTFMNSPASTIVLFLLLGSGIYISMLVGKKSSKLQYEAYELNLDSNRKFGFFLSFMYDYSIGKDIRIFDMKNLIDKEMDKHVNINKELWTRFNKKGLKYDFSIITVNRFAEYAAYIFVGIKAALGIITLGKLTLYVGALKLLNTSIDKFFKQYIHLGLMCNYLQNYTDFLETINEKYEGSLPIEKDLKNNYELEFKNVSFHYPNSEEMILKNVSLKIKAGNKLAIVGKNGAGKTTFIKLLCRLYDPTDGEILLNGINIKNYVYEEYLKLFSVVFQDFKLFSFSVAENIATSLEYDENKIWSCLEQAGIKDRIESFPDGIETNIYNNQEKGIEISGGEAQKLAIARALYKDAPIVILDEPTSALDPVAELEVYEKFNELVQNKTSIFISHRMSSCRFCNNILVFDNGAIVQVGDHEELLTNEEGLYYSLWTAQAQYYA